MTDQSAALTTAGKPVRGGNSLIEQVARRAKVSPFRQFADIFRLKGGKTLLTANEYYEYQVYDPALTPAQKREFVGERGSLALNLRLAPPSLTNMRNFLGDKVGLTSMMGALGLKTTCLQAAVAPTRGFGTLPTLRSPADVVRFLTTEARYPLFGKPVQGYGAFGSVLIRRLDGMIATLGNGQTISVSKLADEVVAHQTYGYMFQDAVTSHPAVATLTGSQALSTIRVVTVNHSDTPEILYTVWKLPAPTAMSDNFWQKGSLIALVEPTSGLVQKIRYGAGLDTQWVQTHPVTGAHLQGATLPCWQSVLDLALAAHATVPDNGILGWDIAITAQGAVLIECNENTGHGLYQLASGRGILNADFLPTFDKITARNTRILQAFASKRKAYQKAKAQF
ncbi:MAG: hypothetical protein H7317_07710 [Pseudorhodobacter sp.]|nr:hypothetical protein [Pseudorhodobacter sp.]